MTMQQPPNLCVVTGASSGIGRAAAVEFAKRGLPLVLAGRDEKRLFETAAVCERFGVTATGLPGDVSNPTYAESLFAKAHELNDAPNLAAVFAAGAATFGPTLELPDSVWEETISTNLTGLFICCRAAINAMLPLGGGRILNVLSIAAKHAFPESAAYVASKFGGLGLTQSLAAEYGDRIRFTAFLPGSTNTPLWERQSWAPNRADMLSPEEVAVELADALLAPQEEAYKEVVILPPKGIL